MSETIIVAVPVFSTLCNAAFDVRRAVFIGEQNVPAAEEFDLLDLTATHLAAIREGEVCGTLRLIETPDHVKIGRVAVRRDHRGRGVAKAMIARGMDIMSTVAGGRFHLDAQSDKIGLYASLGFTAYGDEFLDVGIRHRAMKTY